MDNNNQDDAKVAIRSPDEVLAKKLAECVMRGLADGVKSHLTGYNSPLDKMVDGVLDSQRPKITGLLTDAVKSAIDDPEFCEEIRSETRRKLAGLLVQRFGGELEKQVNALKGDPTTRAKIVAYIDEIVRSKPLSG